MARDLDDAYGEATALYHLVGAASYVGDHQSELAWLRQAEQIDPARVPPVIARRNGTNLAVCLLEMGDLGPARQACDEVLASAREAGAAALEAECLSALADIELRSGQADEGAARLREALGLAAQAGTLALIDCLNVAGHLCAQTQRWSEALTMWAAMAASEREIGLPQLPQEIEHRAEPLSKARRVLGPARAQAAEDRGAAMSLATAIEFAALLAADAPSQPSPTPGQPQLSARERELVTLVAQGRTDAQIAAQLFISVRTVRSHLDRIRDKTGCRRRADLTRLALTVGLV
jgi:DNA-binding CsgD family transcriptional regulator